MSVIHSVHADPNVFSTRTVHAIKAALETAVLIRVWELVAIMLTVELRTTFPFAAAKKPTLAILTDLAVLFP